MLKVVDQLRPSKLSSSHSSLSAERQHINTVRCKVSFGSRAIFLKTRSCRTIQLTEKMSHKLRKNDAIFIRVKEELAKECVASGTIPDPCGINGNSQSIQRRRVREY